MKTGNLTPSSLLISYFENICAPQNPKVLTQAESSFNDKCGGGGFCCSLGEFMNQEH